MKPISEWSTAYWRGRREDYDDENPPESQVHIRELFEEMEPYLNQMLSEARASSATETRMKLKKALKSLEEWVMENTSAESRLEEPCCKWNIANDESYCPVHELTEEIWPSIRDIFPKLKGA
jgi:hypothetical protein